MNTRLLGTIAMVCSPMLLVEALVYRFQDHESGQLVGLLSALFMIGGLCSLAGLLRLDAAGQRWWSKTPLYIQGVILTLALIWALIHLVTPRPDQEQAFYQVTDAAWPLSMIFWLVVGIAVLLARQLPGWRRWTPLLCGLALPLTVVGGALAGDSASGIVFGLYTALAWLLLAYGVRSAEVSATAPLTRQAIGQSA